MAKAPTEKNPLLEDDQRQFFLKSEYRFAEEWLIDNKSYYDIMQKVRDFFKINPDIFEKRKVSDYYGTIDCVIESELASKQTHYAIYRSWIDMLITNISNAIYCYLFTFTEGNEKVKEKVATAKMNEFKFMFR